MGNDPSVRPSERFQFNHPPACERNGKGNMIVTRRDVRNFETSLWFGYAAVGFLGMTIFYYAGAVFLGAGFKQLEFPLLGGLVGCLSSIALNIYFWRKLSKESFDLLVEGWSMILNQSVRTYPLTGIEMDRLQKWAEEKSLTSAAIKVTKAFDDRGEKHNLLGKAAGLMVSLAQERSDCTPEQLADYRKRCRRAERAWKRAKRDHAKAERTAAVALKHFLGVFDFLTKDEPVGIGILHKKYGKADASHVRYELSRQKDQPASSGEGKYDYDDTSGEVHRRY